MGKKKKSVSKSDLKKFPKAVHIFYDDEDGYLIVADNDQFDDGQVVATYALVSVKRCVTTRKLED